MAVTWEQGRTPSSGAWHKIWIPRGVQTPFNKYIVQDRAGWFWLVGYSQHTADTDMGPFDSFDAAATCSATVETL